ncbi:MAG: hypothetical protein GX237_04560 [Clostridiales bacterium]|nr:hypothetical protein [Clostridiales bacterium]
MNYKKSIKASLTVEAALVLPIFICFYIIFIYFIQVFLVQEVMQDGLTKAGLSMSRAAYIYSDFIDTEDLDSYDKSFLEDSIQEGLEDIYKSTLNDLAIKYAVAKNLNVEVINNSSIAGGFDGIRFDGSKIMEGDDQIDLLARYRIRFPISLFGLHEMDMIQRVKFRAWTGLSLQKLYSKELEEEGKDDITVYITETGTVYHKSKTCSHIKLSIELINDKPTWQRNKSGGKYYPCESCTSKATLSTGPYYISSYGDRYHISKDCSRIKRTVLEIPLSEVKSRKACKRCCN